MPATINRDDTFNANTDFGLGLPFQGTVLIRKSPECLSPQSSVLAIKYENGTAQNAALLIDGRLQTTQIPPIALPELTPPCHWQLDIRAGQINFYSFGVCRMCGCCDLDFYPMYRWQPAAGTTSSLLSLTQSDITPEPYTFTTPMAWDMMHQSMGDKDTAIADLKSQIAILNERISNITNPWMQC